MLTIHILNASRSQNTVYCILYPQQDFRGKGKENMLFSQKYVCGKGGGTSLFLVSHTNTLQHEYYIFFLVLYVKLRKDSFSWYYVFQRIAVRRLNFAGEGRHTCELKGRHR